MTLACACASAFFTVACALASAFCTVACAPPPRACSVQSASAERVLHCIRFGFCLKFVYLRFSFCSLYLLGLGRFGLKFGDTHLLFLNCCLHFHLIVLPFL